MPINWRALLEKYAAPQYAGDVRQDVGQLIRFGQQMLAENSALAAALHDAKRTMIALTRSCGSLELPFDVVLGVDDNIDGLQVDDVRRGDALYKRFTYVRRPMN